MKSLHLTRTGKTTPTPAQAWRAGHVPKDYASWHPANRTLVRQLIDAISAVAGELRPLKR